MSETSASYVFFSNSMRSTDTSAHFAAFMDAFFEKETEVASDRSIVLFLSFRSMCVDFFSFGRPPGRESGKFVTDVGP